MMSENITQIRCCHEPKTHVLSLKIDIDSVSQYTVCSDCAETMAKVSDLIIVKEIEK